MGLAASIRAGGAFIELGTRDKLTPGLKRASRQLKAFGAGVSGMGRSMLAASASILAPLAGATKLFASMGDEINKMSQRTGFGAGALSELKFAAEQSGSSLESVEKGIRGMQRSILDAERGLSTATDNFDDLGISLDDIKGKSPEAQFDLLVDKLSSVEDPSRRAALAMKLFGKSGSELLPLLNQGPGGIAKLRKQFADLGGTMTDEQAQAAADLTDAFHKLWTSLKIGAFNVGASLASTLTEIAGKLVEASVKVTDFIKKNGALILLIGKIGVAIGVAGVAFLVAGVAISAFGGALAAAAILVSATTSAIAALAAVVVFINSPVGLLVIGIGALVGVLGFFGVKALLATSAGQAMVNFLTGKFGALKATVLDTFAGIKDALAAGDIKLAGRILWAGLKVVFAQGVASLKQIFLPLIQSMVSGFKTAFDAIAEIIQKIQDTAFGSQRILLNVVAKIDPTGVSKSLLAGLDVAEGFADQLTQTVRGGADALADEMQRRLALAIDTAGDGLTAAQKDLAKLLAEAEAARSASQKTDKAEAEAATEQIVTPQETAAVFKGAPDVLEKGTVAAARKAFENQQRTVDEKMLVETTLVRKATEKATKIMEKVVEEIRSQEQIKAAG